MNWEYVFLAVILNFAIASFISFRYRYILMHVEKKISYFSSLIIVSLSFLFRSIIPFKGGAIVGTQIAGKIKENIDLDKGSVIVAFENIFDTAWQIIILAFILLFSKQQIFGENIYYDLIFIFIILTAVILAIVNHDKFIFLPFKLYEFMPLKLKKFVKKTGLKREHALKYFENLKGLFSKKVFILNYGLRTLLITLLSPLSILFLCYAVNIHISYGEAFICYWVSYILGRLSGLPSGLGIRDVTLGALLVNFGLSTNLSLQVIFLYRLISFFPMLPIGAIYSLHYGKDRIKQLYNEFKKFKEA